MRPSVFIWRRILLVLALLHAPIAQPAVIYRWVDDQGRTHFSDVVPERYKAVAKPVTIRAEPAPASAASAGAPSRVAPVPRASSAPASAPGSAASAPARATAAPSGPVKRPATVPGPDTDCETWARLYRESVECFAPFRTVRGATKAEAFDVCNEVPEPPARCGRMAQTDSRSSR
jgi:hypothetical protein